MAITDPFTGTNGTGITDYSSNWAYAAGSGTMLQIQSNALTVTSSSTEAMAVRTEAAFPDTQYAQAVMTTADAGQVMGVAVRISGDDGVVFAGDDAESFIATIVDGVFGSFLATGNALANGDVLRLSVSGTTYTATINGSTTGAPAAQNIGGFASGKPGVFGFNDAGAVTVRLDDFESTDASGGGTTITPTVGAAVLAGIAPTLAVTAHVAISAAVGALSFSGAAPTVAVSGEATATPTTAALALSGAAPTVSVSDQVTRAPTAGALTFAGAAPTVSTSTAQVVSPGTASLSFAGVAVTQTLTVPSPTAATLSLAGAAPSVNITMSVAPSVGALTFAGVAPTVTRTQNVLVSPAVGSLSIAGLAPAVSATGAVAITPSAGALSITGIASTVQDSGAPTDPATPESYTVRRGGMMVFG